jgi:hypothetical protein
MRRFGWTFWTVIAIGIVVVIAVTVAILLL